MTSRKFPRIEIDQRAYDGLQIEAVLRHRTVREIATDAILSHVSNEALSVLDHKTIGPETTTPEDIATKRPLDHKTTKEKVGAVPVEHQPLMEQLPRMECKKEGEAILCTPRADLPPETHAALAYISEELEAGREPQVQQVADKVGLTTTGLGRELSKLGIIAHKTHRDMKDVRVYTRPMKAKIREILGDT